MFKISLNQTLRNKLLDIRKILHENAELSFKEFNTQNIIKNILTENNIPFKVMGETGVVATIGDVSNDVVALRCDMDALPVNGASHLCGHDYHMTVALGTAILLKELNFPFGVKFIFQPGEEAGGGAIKLIEEGVLENPKVDTIIGYHVWPNVPVGSIEITNKPSMASVDDFIVTFKGKGGHAATPELCINPMYATVSLVNKIENFKKSYKENYVLTLSGLGGAEKSNIISETSMLYGTFRTFDIDVRNKIKSELLKLINSTKEEFKVDYDIFFEVPYPPLIPNKVATNDFINFSKNLLGEDKVLKAKPTFAAEDFSYFCIEDESLKGIHFRLGISDGTNGVSPLHSPTFNASDDCIETGVLLLSNYIDYYYN